MADIEPFRMSKPRALKMIKELAADSDKIVLVGHAKKRTKQRSITRPQIETCVRNGYISEGPFLNDHGHWQVTMSCYATGEELMVVVAIDWPSQLIVITTF